jgi:hypothetical protein
MKPRAVIFIAGAVLLLATLWFSLRAPERPVDRAAVADEGDPVGLVKDAEPVLSRPPSIDSPPTPAAVAGPAKDESDPFGPPRLHPRPPRSGRAC